MNEGETEKKKTERATRLFRSFHGRYPRAGELKFIELPGKELVLEIGMATRIAYIAKGSRKEYIHAFNKRHRPLLFVSSDGRQAYLLKGGYRFTDRGFIG